MKRKEYQKPTINVVEFQQRHAMLVLSQQSVGTQSYDMHRVGDFRSNSGLPDYLDNENLVVNPEALFAE